MVSWSRDVSVWVLKERVLKLEDLLRKDTFRWYAGIESCVNTSTQGTKVRNGEPGEKMMDECDWVGCDITRWKSMSTPFPHWSTCSFWVCLMPLIVFTGTSPSSWIPDTPCSTPAYHLAIPNIVNQLLSQFSSQCITGKYLTPHGEHATIVKSHCVNSKSHKQRQDLKTGGEFRDDLSLQLHCYQKLSMILFPSPRNETVDFAVFPISPSTSVA